MKIFLDANIIFSACNNGSTIAEFLNNLYKKKYKLITCDYAVEEASRNLSAKRPDWLKNLPRILSKLESKPSRNMDIKVELAEKDRIILTSAIYYKCEIMITGDKRDFGHLYGKKISGTKILSPSLAFTELFD